MRDESAPDVQNILIDLAVFLISIVFRIILFHNFVEKIEDLIVEVLIEKLEVFLDHELLDGMHILVQNQIIKSCRILFVHILAVNHLALFLVQFWRLP